MAIAPHAAADSDGIGALIVGMQHVEFGIPITYDDQPDLKAAVSRATPSRFGST